MSAPDLRMFLACVAIWGTTWIAITYQLPGAAPEISVALRFALAAATIAGICRWRGEGLRFGLATHLRFAAMGLSMFTAGYLFVYHAETRVASGLVAVGYCASPIVNQWAYRLALGRAVSRRVTWGGLLGIAGVAMIFWPELSGLTASRDAALGALFTALAVLSSATGNVCSSWLEGDGVSVWQKMAWSMTWGAAGALALGILRGVPLAVTVDPGFALSLLYLTVFGSVIAFAFYLTLLEHIGGGRAGYIGVLVPIVALAISAVFENFAWQPLTFAGIALALGGNLFMLRGR